MAHFDAAVARVYVDIAGNTDGFVGAAVYDGEK
jgi:hypothetical protein